MKNIAYKSIAALVLVFALGTGPLYAAEYWLRADVTTVAMPDGQIITMWGFAQDSSAGVDDGVVTIPGPLLTVPPGDTALTIHLKNNLTAANTGLSMGCPASVVIPGQTPDVVEMQPERFGPGPYPQYEGRIRNLTYDTPPGGTVDYTWTNLRPGSFIYHSGNHLACHVQMGLYGGVIVRPADGEVYPGVAHDAEVVLFYSEIDPVFHAAVASNNYGPGKAMTSTIDYEPRYFLVNGQPYAAGQPAIPAGQAGQTVLVRLFNCGLETHVPVFQNLRGTVIAEDGFPYNYAKDQYSVILPAGKTKDVLITAPAEGTYAVFDRRLRLTNHLASGGGLLSFLEVGPAGANVSPVINAVTATPASIYDDQTSQLAVDADDPDAGPAALTYNWIVPAGMGSVDDPTIANPVYTPPAVDGAVQVVTLTVEVSDGAATESSSVDVSVQKAGTINFNDYSILSYGGSQDGGNSTVAVEDGGVTLHITGNAWKKILLPYAITLRTVIEFDFRSTAAGEIHGIGFDEDNAISTNRTFQVFGTQNWGIQDYHNYTIADDWKHYTIPVGQYYRGNMPQMIFANDHDVAAPTGEGYWRNVMVYEQPITDGLLVNGTMYAVESYGGSQDGVATTTVENGGTTLRIVGNGWKKVVFPYTITADTVLEFDFASSIEGEIHGIGFDTDNAITASRTFQLYGTQNWGRLDYNNYAGETPKHYVIPVGQYYTGGVINLFFANDDDASAAGESVFSNIQVYESVPPPAAPLSAAPMAVGVRRVSRADLNGDGRVDTADIRVLLDQWGRTDCRGCAADLNGDGQIDARDVALFREAFMNDRTEPARVRTR